MSLPRFGAAAVKPRRALHALLFIALCLVSIPVLAKAFVPDPWATPALRPPAARAWMPGGATARASSAAQSTAVAPRPRLTPTPESESKPAAGQWFWLDATKRENGVLFRSPAKLAPTREAPRITIMLHGMCDVPANECPSFAEATDSGWLVCPQASVGCNGGGATWNWKGRVQRIEDATSRALSGREVADHVPRTLIGFSLGALAALDVAQQGTGHYDSLILISGRVYPDARRLRARGVRRVLLAAGDFDGTSAHLRTESQRLERAGVEARFMSLGKVGHQFARDMTRWLTEALSWAEARPEPSGVKRKESLDQSAP